LTPSAPRAERIASATRLTSAIDWARTCGAASGVETPNGAHFTTCEPDYGRDERFQAHYAASAAEEGAWSSFVATYLSGDEQAYQDAVGRFGSSGMRGRVSAMASTSQASRAEVCVAACSDAWRGAGEVLAIAVGTVPIVAARLARLTHNPDLVLSHNEAFFMYGNQNISLIGADWRRPTRQLIGVRGAPGNTVSHRTDYWVARHTTRVFVPRVDIVSGVGNDRAANFPGSSMRFHDLGVVITNLGVLDYDEAGRLKVRSLHPGVTAEELAQSTGFPIDVSGAAQTRVPTAEELELIRTVIDPTGLRDREVRA